MKILATFCKCINLEICEDSVHCFFFPPLRSVVTYALFLFFPFKGFGFDCGHCLVLGFPVLKHFLNLEKNLKTGGRETYLSRLWEEGENSHSCSVILYVIICTSVSRVDSGGGMVHVEWRWN